jgi:serine/threonine protein kinase
MGDYSESDAAGVLREVTSALAFCHGIGIVHGDLKPKNSMLSSAISSDAVVKLVDFGGAEIITSSSDSDATIKQTVTATLPYNKANEDSGRTLAYCPL